MEERVRRRIQSHATAIGAMVKPCLNSVSGSIVESKAEGERSEAEAVERSIADISGGNAGAGIDRPVRGSCCDDKFEARGEKSAMEEQNSVLNSDNSSAEMEIRPGLLSNSESEEMEARRGSMSSDSNAESGIREGMMNPAMGHEAAGSSRWSVDWPVADDCIFCKIVHGYAPAFKLYEDDFCLCILDINPLCYGHSLLVPKGHFPALDVTPPPVAAAMCSVVPLLANVIMEATSCDAFNMVVNSGEAAGQVVFHTHFHIVPRFSGDGLWTNESVIRKPLTTFKDPTQLTHVVRSKLSNRS